MEHGLNLPNRFAMILDHETIQDALKRAAEWKLPRRECHPLDLHTSRRVSRDLEKFDAEIEAAPMTDDELDLTDVTGDAQHLELHANRECGECEKSDDDF